MGKDKDKGKDDPGKNMRRRPGESGDALRRRLQRNIAEGRQTCGACGGNRQVARSKQVLNPKSGKIENTTVWEKCGTCGGMGTVRGRTR